MSAAVISAARPAMKALSVRQPWAWLIVNRFKPIENRSWPTKFRGEFLVHAGLSFDSEAYQRLPLLFPEIQLPPMEAFERGGIVGCAELVDCLPPGSELMLLPEQRPWYQGAYGFLVANAKPLPFQPMKGKLGFFAATDY